MIIKYDELSERERHAYAKGYITGLCCDCKKLAKHDDYNKVRGSQKYCIGCEKKRTIDFLFFAEKINLTDEEK